VAAVNARDGFFNARDGFLFSCEDAEKNNHLATSVLASVSFGTVTATG